MHEKQSFSRHLAELRQRLKHLSIVFIVLTAVSFYYSGAVIEFLQKDLSVSLNALKAYEVLYTEISIALLMGFLLSLPVFIYQGLKFAEPGLKRSEYKILRNYIPFSIILFATGAVFAYSVIVKYSLQFFQSVTSTADIAALWGLQSTVSFALRLSALTGVIFQLPIVALILAKAGLIDASKMKKYRAHFMIAVLLLAAVSTPPDIITQLLVTAPVLLLYQLSIWLVKLSNS
jgi:sec-independent protein translocase protein TatC